ncbi:MAG: hypothetical protein M3N16_03005 [Actinomycetota bacterium]|nr:hypothetical protein [Actinomycetota bacterium]
MRTALKFAVVALIALAFVAVPGGSGALSLLLVLMTIAFFTTIAFFGFRLYREHRFTLDSLRDRDRLLLYASIGLAFLTFAATQRLFELGLGGVLAWLGLLALASFGAYSAFVRARGAY